MGHKTRIMYIESKAEGPQWSRPYRPSDVLENGPDDLLSRPWIHQYAKF